MRVESLRDLLYQFPDIDGFWNFDDLAEVEAKIRGLLSIEEKAWSPKLVELLTQLARVQGLQEKLPEAGATLLLASELLSKYQEAGTERARIRFLIEQGRYFGLSMNPSQSITHFTKALELALKLGDVFFSIEAAVMLSISHPPKFQNDWLQKAIKLAEDASDEQSGLWLSQLYVMNGWHCFDFRKYEAALKNFEKALERPQPPKETLRTLAMRWSVGRTLRALNRLQEALDIQNAILAELNTAGKINGHVFLEIAECLQLLKNPDEAKNYFELAYKELSVNGWYSDNKSSELSRIKHLYKKK